MLPQLVEYNEAVQNPALAFSDSDLKAGSLKVNGLGLPAVMSGGFALTYSVGVGSKRFAVRCFHTDAPDLESRYATISQRLASLKSPYFVEFAFQAAGVRVHGKSYPIVKMAWVDGDPLGIWLDANYGRRDRVEAVRKQFFELAGALEKWNIAHGDIQNLNVMVTRSDKIVLIDYDGMYVPGIPLGRGTELGHKNFQHPKRMISDFGPRMDRFSFIVVDLSLRALVEQPELHTKYKSGGEAIVFNANDFANPSTSEIFRRLSGIPSLKNSVESFRAVCEAEIGAVPTLADFILGRGIPAASARKGPAESTVAARPPVYISQYAILEGTDYPGVLKNVGRRVELIGKVAEVKFGTVKRGKTKGKPYVFINFGKWRGDIVKITIWSEGLDTFRNTSFDNWVGKWISVVGLVDQPYNGKHYDFRYTHVGLTVNNSSELEFLEPREAEFRLGRGGFPRPGTVETSPKPTTPAFPTKLDGTGSGPNRRVIEDLVKPEVSSRHPGSPPSPNGPTTTPASGMGGNNKDIINQLKGGGSAGSRPGHSRGPGTSNVPTKTGQSPPSRSTIPSPPRGLLAKIARWLGFR